MRVLVTGGGCEEPIDGVRFIANFSTGGTAASIAEELLLRGHDVTLLAGIRAVRPRMPAMPTRPGTLQIIAFRGFAELEAALKATLASDRYGLVVHAAAVSDYSVFSVESEGLARPGGTEAKLESGLDIAIRLKPNPKLVDSLKERAGCAVVAFKLTNGANEAGRIAAAAALLERSGADYAVSNDLSELEGERHPFCVYRSSRRTRGEPAELTAFGHTRGELARFIAKLADQINHSINQGGNGP